MSSHGRSESARLGLLAAVAIVAVASLETLSGQTGGQIIVSQPRVWQYERVEALMDGLLRDIEAVSMKDLTGLDPNSPNAASLNFLQTMFEAGIEFDQSVAPRLRRQDETFALTSDAERRNLEAYNDNLDALRQQRARLMTDLFAAMNAQNALAAKAIVGPLSPEEQSQLTSANTSATTIKAQLDQVNGYIKEAANPPSLTTPPMPNSTAGPTLGASVATFGDFLGALPDDFKNAISDGLKHPTFPATKQLENFLALLRERLAAQVSVLQDDIRRSPDKQVFLMQFDVGLYPDGDKKNHMANVEYVLSNCEDCSVYSVYPGQASYNVANYEGTSSGNKFQAGLKFLTGLGANASYQRQRDQLKSSLVQSIYAAGYHESWGYLARFGWNYYPSPFEEYVTPGIHSTFAIVAMKPASVSKVTMRVATAWRKRNEPARAAYAQFNELTLAMPITVPEVPAALTNRDPGKMHVVRLEYNPVTFAPGETSVEVDPLSRCPVKQCTAVMLRLDLPVDANLVVNVRGRPLKRVRDWRGRATSLLPPAQSGTAARSTRSLIERDDLEADSWYQVNSHEILLNISRALAGTGSFPSITLSDAGRSSVMLPYDLGRDHTEIVVSGFRLKPRSRYGIQTYARTLSNATTIPVELEDPAPAPLQTGPYTYSTFLPLFIPAPYTQRIFAYVGQTGSDLLIGTLEAPADPVTGKPVPRQRWLESRVRVILEDRELDFAWSLSCTSQNVLLNCELPLNAIRESYTNAASVCRTAADCPSAYRSLANVSTSTPESESYLNLLSDPGNLASISAPLPEFMGVTSLQVWVSQFDPDGRPGLDSAEPAPLPFVSLSADDQPTPMRFESYDVHTGRTTLEFCGDLTRLISRLTLLSTSRRSLDAHYTQFANCGRASLPVSEFVRNLMVFSASIPEEITLPVSVSTLTPVFGTPTVSASQILENDALTTTHWNVEWPVSRIACGDAVHLGSTLNASADVRVAWVIGANDTLTPCSDLLWMRFRDGDARLRVTVPRSMLAQLPEKLTILRQIVPAGGAIPPKPLPNVESVPIASTDFSSLILPTELTLEVIGGDGFALRGDRAGELSAVLLQSGGASVRRPADAVGSYARVQTTEEQKPGDYVIVPLVNIGTRANRKEVPVRAIGQNGQPLLYNKPKPTETKAEEKLPNKSTTRTTVTTESNSNTSQSTTIKQPPKP